MSVWRIVIPRSHGLASGFFVYSHRMQSQGVYLWWQLGHWQDALGLQSYCYSSGGSKSSRFLEDQWLKLEECCEDLGIGPEHLQRPITSK
eukprot:8509855-Alexandrium_andersonii.AAC.1